MQRFSFYLSLLMMAAVGLFILTPAPKASQVTAISSINAKDRKALEALIHDYILENPEIIPQAIAELQRREANKLLSSYRSDIETPFPGAVAGNPQGDVTLVEFFDYRCPYCKQAYKDVDRLIADDPNLRVVFREFPVLDGEGEPLSRRAALASLAAARQGKYIAFHDRLFGISGRLTQELLVASVREIGLDERRLADDMSSPTLNAEVDKNLDLGRTLGLSGTPSYIIGNQIISGSVGYDALKAAIAKARSRDTKASNRH